MWVTASAQERAHIARWLTVEERRQALLDAADTKRAKSAAGKRLGEAVQGIFVGLLASPGLRGCRLGETTYTQSGGVEVWAANVTGALSCSLEMVLEAGGDSFAWSLSLLGAGGNVVKMLNGETDETGLPAELSKLAGARLSEETCALLRGGE